MRQVLIEFARMRKAERRGGSQTTLSLDENVSAVTTENKDPESLVQIGILMDRLEKRNAETARTMTRSTYAVTLNPQLIDPMLQLAMKAKITDRLVTATEMIAH